MVSLFRAIVDTLEAPVEARRLQRCGLTEYWPQDRLQTELWNAHRFMQVINYLNEQEMRQRRGEFKARYERHWAKICWEYVAQFFPNIKKQEHQ